LTLSGFPPLPRAAPPASVPRELPRAQMLELEPPLQILRV